MSRVHTLKVWPEPFAALRDGRKCFEWRKDDRGFAVGDQLFLEEWDPMIQKYMVKPFEREIGRTGSTLRRTVTYIARGQWGIPDDYVVMSLAKLEKK